MSKAEMMRQANKVFPGIHGTKKRAPDVIRILSMQSMLPPIHIEKLPIDAPPRGPVRIREFRVNSQTKPESLARAFTPRWTWSTEHHPHKIVQMEELRMVIKRPVCLLYAVSGLAAAETTELRATMIANGVAVKFAKPSLAELALKEAGHQDLAALAKGQLLLMHSDREPSAIRTAFAKLQGNRKMILLSGLIEGRVWTPSECAQLIERTPSRATMMGTLVGLLEAPLQQFVGTLEYHLVALAQVLEARRAQMEAAGK